MRIVRRDALLEFIARLGCDSDLRRRWKSNPKETLDSEPDLTDEEKQALLEADDLEKLRAVISEGALGGYLPCMVVVTTQN
jgi:hypothetical protein